MLKILLVSFTLTFYFPACTLPVESEIVPYMYKQSRPKVLDQSLYFCCRLKTFVFNIKRQIWDLGFACADCEFTVKRVTNMKNKECFIREKQPIMKLREEDKSITAVAQTLAMASRTVWNVVKKKVITGVLSNRCQSNR